MLGFPGGFAQVFMMVASPRRCRLSPPSLFDGGDVDLLHRHHRLEGALGLAASSRKRVGEHTGSNLPGQAPAILAPPALTFVAAIADDRVPVAVRLFLIVSRHLERECLAVLERRTAVQAEARNAQNGELDRYDIALLAAGVVS